MSEESKAELDELCRQAVKEKHDEQRAIELYNQVLRYHFADSRCDAGC